MSLLHDRRAAELFASACDLAPDAQRALIDELQRTEPESAAALDLLLRADRAPDARLETPALAHARGPGAAGASELDAALPERLGRYRIVSRLGVGGMGVVYEAEQDEPRRRVALKVLRAGFVTEDLLARFRAEAEVLGRLAHPYIAQVHEAGTARTAGGIAPFFAMELVRGESLTSHAESHALDARARLDLVARICDAVAHAHSQGVIHRDLKPSNVWVDERGEPKVLDFGIARVTRSDLEATAPRTRSGELVGTLAYMSPEQVEGRPEAIDERADVYALGAIAYRLLAGRTPHDLTGLALPAAARAIVEEEPEPLGAIDAAYRGDVETIVAKALAPERDRRYRSAEALAADIRRFLSHRPIAARRATASYQLARFARRNRALVGGLAGVFAAVCTGFAVSLSMYLRAEEARAAERDMRTRAEEAAKTLRETNATFLGFLEAPNPWAQGVDVKLIDVLDSAAARAGESFVDRPRQRAELLRTLGRTYAGIGSADRAAGLLAQALALYGEDVDPIARAELRQELASARFDASDFDGALELAERALADLGGEPEPADPLVVALLERTRASVLLEQGRVGEAEVIARRVLGELETIAAPRDEVIGARQLLVHALTVRGAYAEAEELCRRTIEELESAGRGSDAKALMAMNTLGLVLHKARRNAEAIPWLERSLAGTRALAGADHPFVATQTQNLATLLRGVGQLERAEALYREALAMSRARWQPPHADIAYKLGNLGSLVGDTGRTEEALALLDEADRMLVELLGPRSLQRAFNWWYRGSALVRAGRLDEAVADFESALDVRRELLPPVHPEIAGVHMDLGSTHFYRRDFVAAARHYRAAREIWIALEGEVGSGRVLASSVALAVALAESGAAEESVALAESALCDVETAYPGRADLAALHSADLGWCLFLAGSETEGRARIEAALPVIRDTYGEEHAHTSRQLDRLARMAATGR